MGNILNIVFAILVLVSVSLQKTYSALPAIELKRRARSGNGAAKAMYRAASYGQSLRAVLWIMIIGLSAGFFLTVSLSAPAWFALTASVALIWIAYVWLPSSPVTNIGKHLAAFLAPPLAHLLTYLHVPISKTQRVLRGGKPNLPKTNVYEKADLIDFLKLQSTQADNRIDETELQMAMSALTFGEKPIRKLLTPRRMVKVVSVQEDIGPILMDELHASGHSRFPVHDGKKDNIVGTLYMRDLVGAKSSGTVKQVMKHDVAYVNEEQNLFDALQAVIKSHHHLLVVVNSFEEYVGIITLEDILEQIIGKPIIDEFDQYHDLRAVAARAAKEDRQEHQKAETTTPDQTEVVE